ncbi:RNA polymerase sigma-E factor [bioreactor metagenome]|uniref:RNA polymerase sigma-E factor n=1 Tax=bioreactor metagenome TaxID=1076179 RepID=A0A644XQ99_9ZZZZ
MEQSREEIDFIIREHQGLVLRTARRYFPRRARDQDLLQCGLIGLWEAARGWRKTGRFESYARTCVYHNMLSYLRAEKRAPIPVEELPEEAREEESESVDRIALLERISAAWPENSRERYVLIALSAGVTKTSIACALGVGLPTVRKIAQRAFEKIKD